MAAAAALASRGGERFAMIENAARCERTRLTPRQRWWFVAALVAVTSHFSLAYIAETKPFLELRAFASGQGPQPFQERALMGWVLRGANHFDSPQVESVLHHWLPSLGTSFNQTVLTLLLVVWVSMAGSILLTRESLLKLTGDAVFSTWACFLVPYMAYFTYILNFGPHFLLPYDLPSLFFFCAGMYLLLMRRPLVLVPLIALATLNRETALFLVVFYVLFSWPHSEDKRQRGAVLAYAAAMIVAWLAVRLVVLHLYGHNPLSAQSRIADVKLWQNLGFLVRPQHWPALASVFGFSWPLVVALRRRMEPRYLERGLIAVALWLLLMLVVGVVIEIRIFGELISYMSLALGVILYRELSARGAVASGAG